MHSPASKLPICYLFLSFTATAHGQVLNISHLASCPQPLLALPASRSAPFKLLCTPLLPRGSEAVQLSD